MAAPFNEDEEIVSQTQTDAPGIAKQAPKPQVTGSYGPNSEAAKEAIQSVRQSRTGWKDMLQSAVMGAAAGSKASEGSLSPLNAFLQGAAAGMQVPSQIYKAKQEQLKSVMDASPLEVTHPEIFEGHPEMDFLKGIPTGIAMPAILKIGETGAQVAAESKARQEQMRTAEDIGTVDLPAAKAYATMANEAFGFGPKESIQPQELVGMRKADVEAFIRFRSSKGGGGYVGEYGPNDKYERIDPMLAQEYGLPEVRLNPYKGMPPKIYERVRTAQSTMASKDLANVQAEVAPVTSTVGLLSEALSLIRDKGLKTGPVIATIRPTSWTTDAKRFEQIAMTELPKLRAGLPGALSDRDMAMLQSANIGLKVEEGANIANLEKTLAAANRAKDRASFLTDYITLFKDRSSADQAWQRYALAVPVFDAQGKVLTNIPTYKDFFRSNPEALISPLSTKKDTLTPPIPTVSTFRAPDGSIIRGIKLLDGSIQKVK